MEKVEDEQSGVDIQLKSPFNFYQQKLTKYSALQRQKASDQPKQMT